MNKSSNYIILNKKQTLKALSLNMVINGGEIGDHIKLPDGHCRAERVCILKNLETGQAILALCYPWLSKNPRSNI